MTQLLWKLEVNSLCAILLIYSPHKHTDVHIPSLLSPSVTKAENKIGFHVVCAYITVMLQSWDLKTPSQLAAVIYIRIPELSMEFLLFDSFFVPINTWKQTDHAWLKIIWSNFYYFYSFILFLFEDLLSYFLFPLSSLLSSSHLSSPKCFLCF